MNLDNSPVVYLVYYDQKTGNILSITNEKNDSYETGISAEYAEVEKLITGEWKFTDYKVGYKDTSDKSSLGILSRDYFYLDYSFKNRTFEWIADNPSADCIVEWNSTSNSWNFYLSDDFKRTYSNNILETQLMFFVTMNNDFDFLIRTIFVKVSDIISLEKITIPFESKIETMIDKVSIGTKILFKTYGLKVIK